MEKVKIIVSSSYRTVESEANTWLEINSAKVEVIDIRISVPSITSGCQHVYLLIRYKVREQSTKTIPDSKPE